MVKGAVCTPIFDGIYTISTDGEIYSFYIDGSEIKKHVNKDGYPAVSLTVGGNSQSCTVHRLLANTFIPNPENKPQVNHRNGNKLDYRLTNLEWSTASENMQHAVEMGLNKPFFERKKVVDTSTGKEYPSIKEAAADLNINYSSCKKYLLGLVKNKTSLQYA